MAPLKAGGQTQTQCLLTNPPFSHVGGFEQLAATNANNHKKAR